MGLGAASTIELLYWLRLAALAGLLGFTIVQARRRWLRGGPDDMARRILLPWLVILFGFSIYLGLLTILISPIALFWVVAIVAFWVAVPAVASILVVDLGAKLLQAERTGFWLGAGLVAYLAVTLIWLGLLGIGPLLLQIGLWLELLALGTIPAAGALVWWSYLPGGGGGSGIAETFE
jgi:hypothetical protein